MLSKIYNNNIYTYKYYNKEGMLVNFFTNEDLKNLLIFLQKTIDNYKI